MTGQVLGYSLSDKEGYISGDDGQRYRFTNSEWPSNAPPGGITGLRVDFEVDDNGRAINMYILSPPPTTTARTPTSQSPAVDYDEQRNFLGIPLHRKWLIGGIIALIVIGVSCGVCLSAAPSSIEISNATDAELDQACTALSHVGYDYYQINVMAVGGRILEVAASIHTDHAGSDKTRKYCEGR